MLDNIELLLETNLKTIQVCGKIVIFVEIFDVVKLLLYKLPMGPKKYLYHIYMAKHQLIRMSVIPNHSVTWDRIAHNPKMYAAIEKPIFLYHDQL